MEQKFVHANDLKFKIPFGCMVGGPSNSGRKKNLFIFNFS
jgi:hypothetical protein